MRFKTVTMLALVAALLACEDPIIPQIPEEEEEEEEEEDEQVGYRASRPPPFLA